METLALVENIRSGVDVEASQSELYVRIRDTLLVRLRREIYSRVRKRLDAEDVLDETFIRVLNGLDLFEAPNENAFYGWVFRIAKNLITDQSRRRSLGAQTLRDGADVGGPRVSAIRDRRRSPDSLLGDHEWLHACLHRLKEKEQEVIRLRKLEGRSFDEIGEAWGKSPGAIQRFFSRAWHKLCALAREQAE